MTSAASVIVRCLDSERTIAATFEAIRGQTIEAEIVVVDSGSRDRTLEIAGHWGDRIVELSPAEFSYGRALNRGAQAASGKVHFAVRALRAPQAGLDRALARALRECRGRRHERRGAGTRAWLARSRPRCEAMSSSRTWARARPPLLGPLESCLLVASDGVG